jgi:hypothetical protein
MRVGEQGSARYGGRVSLTPRRQVLALRAGAILLAAVCFPAVLQTISDFISVVLQVAGRPTPNPGGILDGSFGGIDTDWLRRMLIERSAEIAGFAAGLVLFRLPGRAAARLVGLTSSGGRP